jgi:hypothetical protein
MSIQEGHMSAESLENPKHEELVICSRRDRVNGTLRYAQMY